MYLINKEKINRSLTAKIVDVLIAQVFKLLPGDLGDVLIWNYVGGFTTSGESY